jgi:hypothetical protein
MADISNMTTKQKTAKLCALVGWWVLHDQIDERGGFEYYRSWLADSHEQPILSDNKATGSIDWDSRQPRSLDYSDFVDLYDEQHMALAWQVLNWADVTLNKIIVPNWRNEADNPYTYGDLLQWWWDETCIFGLLHDNAQGLWLDKILELATEAELV